METNRSYLSGYDVTALFF